MAKDEAGVEGRAQASRTFKNIVYAKGVGSLPGYKYGAASSASCSTIKSKWDFEVRS